MKTAHITLHVILFAFIAYGSYSQETAEQLKLANISCRAFVGESPFIAGFTINSERRVLIRAVGPGLGRFNVAGVCKDPIVTLYNGQTVIDQNDNWDSSAETSQVFTKAGAFSLFAQSTDAVIVTTLQPGIYTAIMTCAMGEEGVALLEVYDLDWKIPGGISNLSMLGFAGKGDRALVPGITIGGHGTGYFLFRAIGPGLAQFGVENFTPDPKLVITSGPLYRQENDNWQTTVSNASSIQRGAFPLPSNSKDSALILATRNTTGPSNVTSIVNAHIEDVADASGIALFEVFQF